jgi:hypothetical protein
MGRFLYGDEQEPDLLQTKAHQKSKSVAVVQRAD